MRARAPAVIVASALLFVAASAAAQAESMTPMTPDGGDGPPLPSVVSWQAPQGQPRAARHTSPYLTTGIITLIVSALQVPVGVGVFVAGNSCNHIVFDVAGGGFGDSCNPGPVIGTGVFLMVNGGLGVITGAVLIGLGAGGTAERRTDIHAFVPKLSPSPRGALATWSF